MPQALRDAVRAHAAPPWLPELAALVGADHVSDAAPDLWVYARDRLPYATFAVRDGRVPGTLPSAVVRPGTEDELAAVVRFARARRIPLIPYGAGSGVLGGAVPVAHELVVDLKRLNRIVSIDETDLTVTVQAGMNGGQFEAALNARGFTTGHLPQSLYMSTVGGWAACRGAGQNSTRYGKIEDMVLGLRAILPDGQVLQVRPVARRAVGPSVKDLMIGAEGGRLRDHLVTKLDNGVSAARMLQDGKVVAAAGLRSELESALRGDARFEIGPLPIPRAPRDGWAVGMAVRKEATDLAQALQGAVEQLSGSGEMERLFAAGGLRWQRV